MIINFEEPWEEVDPTNSFSNHLKNEICKGHVLYALKTKAIARRIDRDDFLFKIEDQTNRVASVHLTWHKQIDPQWPVTMIYEDLESWYKQSYLQDLEQWL